MNIEGRRGFTIVELLIVVVIIGIVAAIVIVAYRGVTNRAYMSRSQTELETIGKAIQIYYTTNGRYPADVERGVPAEVIETMNGPSSSWPIAPWPDSVYDYDSFVGSDGKEVSQISIRFCPVGGPISACKFPNESWASNFNVNSSVYWCVTGKCRAHPSELDTYPGKCVNC